MKIGDNMIAEKLRTKQKNFRRTIRRTAEKHKSIDDNIGDNAKPIYDGVADIEGYLKSDPKIMWLLKEPYDESGKFTGGGWSFISNIFNDPKSNNPNKPKDCFWTSTMWQLIIQINYAIHNGYRPWGDIPPIDNEIANEIKKSAYINLSKMPADSKSSNSRLSDCYQIWKDTIFRQIDIYKPDIIIFGKTFQFFKDNPRFKGATLCKKTRKKWPVLAYISKDNTILIEAYHPARKGGENSNKSGRNYVDNIIKAVKYAMQNK